LLAFGTYKLYAVRDLAIFGYSVFFPLTYFAVDDGVAAQGTIRAFVYAGAILGLLVVVNVLTGAEFGGLLHTHSNGMYFEMPTESSGGGDVAGIAAFSAGALLAYAFMLRRRRWLHMAMLLFCIVASAAIPSRSSTVALVLAAALMWLSLASKRRVAMACIALLVVVLVIGAVSSFPHNPIANRFEGLELRVASLLQGPQADPTSAFRMRRWSYAIELWETNPLVGVGFGRLILPYGMDWRSYQAGMLNAGMPHNTFLFVLDRMGILGLGLIVFCWSLGIARGFKTFKRSRHPDVLAATNILVAMAGFAAFVLFFERPMNNASFWIMLAVAQRLAETSRAQQRRVGGERFQPPSWVREPWQEPPAMPGPAPAAAPWAARRPA
jgi:O-antigen ligase